MNWASINFDWNQARAFLVTAETGSFSAAARALNMAQPTLGRQVAGLEETLGIVLFERIGRKLVLTPAGLDMLEHIRTMGHAANHASLTATGHSQTIAGDVCISVTDIIAQYVMPQIIAELRVVAPQVRIRVLASNDLSDLQRREADIAVRHVAPTESELICRKVREAKGRLYASRKYLDRFGPIETKEDVANADFIGVGNEQELITFIQQWGLPITKENLKVLSDSGLISWEIARTGLGLMPMSDDLIRYFPEMVLVLPELEAIPIPYWLTTHKELHSSKRIRLVYDKLAEAFSKPKLPD